MTSELLKRWLAAMVESMPRGGRSQAARQLKMTASGFSKLLNDDSRQFDEKTIQAMLWMQLAKSEACPDEKKYPVVSKVIRDGLVIETRRNVDGALFCTWHAAEQ